MENVILTIHLILALLLIGTVLLQRSEGGGLGIGGGAGGSILARGSATPLTKLTWIFAIAFIITSMTLTVLATRGADNGSVVDALEGATVESDTEEPISSNPELTGDLTAPVAEDAPAAPPRADEPAEGGETTTAP